jgi:hypothetical protein
MVDVAADDLVGQGEDGRPAPTVPLALLRDAADDYEVLKLAEARAGGEPALTELLAKARDLAGDPAGERGAAAKLLGLRQQLGDLLSLAPVGD